MADEPENLVLVALRRIDEKIDRISAICATSNFA